MSHIITTTLDQLHQYPTGIAELYQRTIDGFIVKQVIPREQLQPIVENIYKDKNNFNPFASFSVLNDSHHLGCINFDTYLGQVEQNRQQLNDIFGASIETRILKILAQLSANKSVATYTHHGKPFKGCVMRITTPGDAIYVHAHNQFTEDIPDYQRLGECIELYDQIAFYILIQKPEEGGKLQFYNLMWEETSITFRQRSLLISTKSWEDSFEQLYDPVETLPLQEGDMIVFAGGRVWHKVTKVTGNTDRITVGGFLAKAKENSDRYFIWS